MNSRTTGTIWKAPWLVIECMVGVALFALTAESADQIYDVVIKSLVTSRSLSNLFWAIASIAGFIPVGFFLVYFCILVVLYGCRAYKRVFGHQ